MRSRILWAGLALSVAACNPVDASRTFDPSRGTTRYVLVTRFPRELRPRAFEQAGPMAEWRELEIPDASELRVEVNGRQLLIPAAEENVVLEYYDRELAIPAERTAQDVFRDFAVAVRSAVVCGPPLCTPAKGYCTPLPQNVVQTSTVNGLGILAIPLHNCPS
jgi:hypothetical protein